MFFLSMSLLILGFVLLKISNGLSMTLKNTLFVPLKTIERLLLTLTNPTKNNTLSKYLKEALSLIKPYTVKGIAFPVLLLKKIYHNLDGSTGVQYLISTDIDVEQMSTIYKQRWASEDLHRSLKQNTALEKLPAKVENSQANHVFVSMIAQLKLECLKIATNKNHYQLKRTILVKALKTAWDEIKRLKEICSTKNTILPNFSPA